MDILLCLKDKDSREILMFTLESRYRARVFDAADAAAGIALLKTEPKIRLVISDHPGNAKGLVEFLGSFDRSVPTALCAAKIPNEAPFMGNRGILGVIDAKNLAGGLSTLIETYYEAIFAAEERPDVSFQDLQHCRIATSLLLRVSPLKSDVYVRLSPVKYVKYYSQGDVFDRADFAKVAERKGLRYLYLRKDATPEFSGKLKADLAALAAGPTLAISEAAVVTQSVHEAVRELVSQIGPTEEVQQIVKASVQVTLKAAGKNPDLRALLSQMAKDKTQYLSAHSILLANVATALALAMEWKSDQTMYKLHLAAFLHDVSLTNNDLAMTSTLDELKARSDLFTKEEVKSYPLHPSASADVARRFNEVPPDVDVIISQHHEQPDGSGFPHQLTHVRLGPLSCLFIIAHDIVHYIFDREGEFDLGKYLTLSKERYSQGHFKKVLKLVESLKLA